MSYFIFVGKHYRIFLCIGSTTVNGYWLFRYFTNSLFIPYPFEKIQQKCGVFCQFNVSFFIYTPGGFEEARHVIHSDFPVSFCEVHFAVDGWRVVFFVRLQIHLYVSFVSRCVMCAEDTCHRNKFSPHLCVFAYYQLTLGLCYLALFLKPC